MFIPQPGVLWGQGVPGSRFPKDVLSVAFLTFLSIGLRNLGVYYCICLTVIHYMSMSPWLRNLGVYLCSYYDVVYVYVPMAWQFWCESVCLYDYVYLDSTSN